MVKKMGIILKVLDKLIIKSKIIHLE